MSKREFNPKSFFRKFRPDIRDHLLGQLNLLSVLEKKKLEGDPEDDAVFFAWTRADSEQRHIADREFMRINDLACDNARPYLNEVAARLWHDKPKLRDEALDMANQDLAALIFLESKTDFEAVYADFFIDDFSFRVMRQAKEARPVALTPEKKAQFEDALVRYYRGTLEGNRQVQIEDHNDETRFALFVYHEDRLRYKDRFGKDGRLVSAPDRPVENAMIVYYPSNGLLTVKAHNKKLRDHLISLIGEIYFADSEFFEGAYRREFDLSSLTDPDFGFSYRASDGISGVRVVEVAFSHPDHRVGLVTAHCLTGHQEALRALRIAPDSVEFCGVRIEVLPDGRVYKRKRTVVIQKPDRWNLKETPRDRILAKYVEEWGFIKKETTDERERVADLMDDAERLQESLRARVAARYTRPNPDMAH